MSIFEKLGKSLGVSSKGIDVEEYMNAAEMDDVDVMHEPGGPLHKASCAAAAD